MCFEPEHAISLPFFQVIWIDLQSKFSWQLHISSEWTDLHLHKRIKVKDKRGPKKSASLLLVLKKLSIASGALNFLFFFLFHLSNSYSLIFSWTIYLCTVLLRIRRAFDYLVSFLFFFFKNTGVFFSIRLFYSSISNQWISKSNSKSESVSENIARTSVNNLKNNNNRDLISNKKKCVTNEPNWVMLQ